MKSFNHNKKTLLNQQGMLLVPVFIEDLKHLQTIIPENSTNLRFCHQKIPQLEKYIATIRKFIAQQYPNCRFVRSILFNKNATQNWPVLWHQDTTICLKEKIDLQGYGPWSIKDAIHHVRPPLDILENMVTARLHIDDSSESNGAIKVIPQSHLKGLLTRPEINDVLKEDNELFCLAQAGDLMLMKPLLLHSSLSAKEPTKRRVLHLEFITTKLPQQLTLLK
jgi:ectoine hydroxylase-related dioxygenase (phytanoyl-CoA dioxygenase family)